MRSDIQLDFHNINLTKFSTLKLQDRLYIQIDTGTQIVTKNGYFSTKHSHTFAFVEAVREQDYGAILGEGKLLFLNCNSFELQSDFQSIGL